MADSESFKKIITRYEALQKGLSRIHDSEYFLNLDQNRYYVYKIPDALKPFIPTEGTKDELAERFIGILEKTGVDGPDGRQALLDEVRLKFTTKWLRENLVDNHLAEIDYHRERDGIEKWFRISLLSVGQNEKGIPNEIMVFTVDVTDNVLEKFRLQKKLQQANAKLEKEISLIRSLKNIYMLSLHVDLKNDYVYEIEVPEEYHKLIEETNHKLSLLSKKTVDTIYIPELRENLLAFLNPADINIRMADRDLLTFEYQGQDGRWRRSHLIVAGRDARNQITDIVYATQDIEEIKRTQIKYQEALIEAAKAADSANQAKTEFLSQMSHDIRTPLNAIIGFSNLLINKNAGNESVIQYTKKILSSSEQLLGLINDVLDMSKIEAGKVDLTEVQFQMEDMVSEIQDIIMELAMEKNHTLLCSIHESARGEYETDVSRVIQILINLLGNSVKYTPDGGTITLSVRALEHYNGNFTKIEFTVEDNGCGMSKAFLKKIFSPFAREAKEETKSVQGTGLGLSITKNLVELMGGSIDVVSKDGVGSKFTVVIPMKDCSSIGSETSESAKKPKQENFDILNGLNILVAEDNFLNQEIISEILKMNGAQVHIAKDGKECLEEFEKAPPGTYDLILMDIQMPVMNGLESTRAIRALSAAKKNPRADAKDIPIIAVTANAFSDDVRNAIQAGMNDHIAKPINVDYLKKSVATFIQKVRP